MGIFWKEKKQELKTCESCKMVFDANYKRLDWREPFEGMMGYCLKCRDVERERRHKINVVEAWARERADKIYAHIMRKNEKQENLYYNQCLKAECAQREAMLNISIRNRGVDKGIGALSDSEMLNR